MDQIIISDKKILLAEIQSISAYKVDLFTVDEVRFDIEMPDMIVTVCEEDSNFDMIDTLLAGNLDGYNAEWREQVMHPPFAESKTSVYSKCR